MILCLSWKERSTMAKIVIKEDGEKLVNEKNFDDAVCLIRRNTGEHILFIAGRPEIAIALMCEATARITEKMNDAQNENM